MFNRIDFMIDQLLSKVKRFYLKNKRLPTYREMAGLFSFSSTNAVFYRVRKWLKQGIFVLKGKRLSPTSRFFSLPLLGIIKAGSPTMEDYQEETFFLDSLINPNGGNFLLKVSGDSMINEGIFPDDLVVIDQNKAPKNGSIVAALVDNQWTLKYFKRIGGRIILEAANPKYKPIIPKENLAIAGVVISSIRKYS